MPDTSENYHPALIVGLGGAGAEVLRNIKRRMHLYPDRDRGPVKLLLIDSDLEEQQRGEPEVHFSKEEFFDISLDFIPFAIQREIERGNPGLSHIDWVPVRERYTIPPPSAGRQQTRFIGRLSFFQVVDVLEQRLEKLFQGLATYLAPSPEQPDASPQVYLITSICGGIGAGIFLDVAYLLRHHLRRYPEAPLTGFLVLPGAFANIDVAKRIMNANACAALMELDHFMNTQAFHCCYGPEGQGRDVSCEVPPFDFCYLIEGQNERGVPLEHGYRDVVRLIAEAVFLRFGSEVDNRLPTRNSGYSPAFARRVAGKRTAYSAFGMQGLVLPVAQARQVDGAQLGLALVKQLLEAAPPPRAAVASELDLLLQEQHLADREDGNQLVKLLQSLGHTDHPVHFASPETKIDYAKPRSIRAQLAELLAQLQAELAIAQRALRQQSGTIGKTVTGSIAKRLCELLDTPDGGLTPAIAFLTALKDLLTKTYQQCEGQQAQQMQQQSEADRQLESALPDIERIGKAIFTRGADKDRELRIRVPEYLALATKNVECQFNILVNGEAITLLQQFGAYATELLERTVFLQKTLLKLLPEVHAAVTRTKPPAMHDACSQMLPVASVSTLLASATVQRDWQPSTWLNLEKKTMVDIATLRSQLLPPPGERVPLAFPGIEDFLGAYMQVMNVTRVSCSVSVKKVRFPCCALRRARTPDCWVPSIFACSPDRGVRSAQSP